MTKPQGFKVVLKVKRNLRTISFFKLTFPPCFWEELRVGHGLEIHSVDQ